MFQLSGFYFNVSGSVFRWLKILLAKPNSSVSGLKVQGFGFRVCRVYKSLKAYEMFTIHWWTYLWGLRVCGFTLGCGMRNLQP